MKGHTKDGRPRVILAAPHTPRPPDINQLLSDLVLIQDTGLRAVVELRGFASHDLADMLYDALGSVAAIHTAAQVRLREVA